MRKYLFAAAALVIAGGSAQALRIAFRPVSQRAATAEVVVAGKVTAVEKDTVDALAPHAGAKNTVAYTVAVVKIDSALSGAANVTHIKVGVPVSARPQPGNGPIVIGGRGPAPIDLKEGQEWLLFLTKHPSTDFYVIPNMSGPIDLKTDFGKKELETVKKVTEALADPMQGLKSEKADVRALTATALVARYRSYPDAGGSVDQVAIDATESGLILKALAEDDWSAKGGPGIVRAAAPIEAFSMLGLTEKDGWKPPPPARPPADFQSSTKEAFVKWLDGPGKGYRIKKFVPKT